MVGHQAISMHCNPVCGGLGVSVAQKQFNISPLSKDRLTVLATESHEIPLASNIAIERKADVLVPEFHRAVFAPTVGILCHVVRQRQRGSAGLRPKPRGSAVAASD